MIHRISLISPAVAGAAVLALTALPAAAHPSMHGCGGMRMAGKMPMINVQGEGRANVAPDLATVSLGVTTQASTAAQAMADNAARQTAVIEALRAQGVAPADLQTQGLSLSPMQDFSREGQPPVITGYQAQNIVTARIRDLERLGPLLDAMVAAGATDVQGVSFSREDAAATEDRARTEAVTEARRRAEVIANAAGMELGPLVSLTDTSMSEGPRPLAMMARAADAEASTPVATGELTLTAQVTGVWSLVPAGGEAGHCGPQGHHMMHSHGMQDRGDKGRHQGDRGRRDHPERLGVMPQDGDEQRDNGRRGDREPASEAPEWQLAPAPQPLSPPAASPGDAAAPAPAGDTGNAAPNTAEPAPSTGGVTGTAPSSPATGEAEAAPSGTGSATASSPAETQSAN